MDIPAYESKLAVFCILNINERPMLLLNRSKPYFNYTDTSHEFQYIDDALVTITDANTGIKDTLLLEKSRATYWVFNGQASETSYPHYAGKNKPEIGHRYILEIWHKGKYINAETFIPKPITIKSVTYKKTKSLDYEGYNDVTFSLEFDDIRGEENAYVTNYFGSSSYTDFTYIYDKNKDGEELTDIYEIPMRLDDTGTIGLKVENQTPETAAYISSVYAQKQVFSHLFTEPYIIKHNINGGLGIFGATTQNQLWFLVHVE